MSRHITDHPREGDNRALNFARIERSEGIAGPHHTSQHLQQRQSAPPDATQRSAEFVRIERGKQA